MLLVGFHLLFVNVDRKQDFFQDIDDVRNMAVINMMEHFDNGIKVGIIF